MTTDYYQQPALIFQFDPKNDEPVYMCSDCGETGTAEDENMCIECGFCNKHCECNKPYTMRIMR